MNKTLQVDDCWNRIGVWSTATDRCERLAEVIHCYNCEKYSESGHSLLNREIPGDYKQEWTRLLAMPEEPRKENEKSILVFRLGSEWLGVPVHAINEVALMRPVFALPHNTNRVIKGLVNIRGILTICISLGSLIGVDKPDEDWEESEHSIQRLIIFSLDSGDIVFPVSEVHSITRYTEDQLETAPFSGKADRGDFICGMLSWNNLHIGCLDINRLITAIDGVLL